MFRSFVLLAYAILYVSCSKEEPDPSRATAQKPAAPTPTVTSFTPVTIVSQPYETRLAYTYHHLGVLGKGLVHLSRNAQFREVLYQEVEKQQWGEYNALFVTLERESKEKNFDLLSTMKQAVSGEDLKAAWWAFYGIDGEILYLHIYIPYFEVIQQRSASHARISTNESPTIVIYGGDETIETYLGYKLSPEGKIIETGKIVDEAYAKENEVWVIALNEVADKPVLNRICGIGEEPPGCDPIDPNPDPDPGPKPNPPLVSAGCDDGNTGVPTTITSKGGANGLDVRIKDIQVTCHRESWVAGATDIKVSASTASSNANLQVWGLVEPTNGGLPYNEVYGFTDITKITREGVNNKSRIVVNKSIQRFGKIARSFDPIFTAGWIYWGSRHAMFGQYLNDTRHSITYYCIYEFDRFPAAVNFIKVRSYGVPGTNEIGRTASMRYESSNDAYLTGWYHWYKKYPYFYPCNLKQSGSCINFTLITAKGWDYY